MQGRSGRGTNDGLSRHSADRNDAPSRPSTVFRTISGVSRAVVSCERCPRLRTYCRRIALEKRRAYRDETYWGRPVPGFGDPSARLLIVGLAPAAHGGNRTGRIFTGDASGNWLYEALHAHGFANQPFSTGRFDGLRLTDCYVTAAGHCAPPENMPTRGELDACQPYLEAEIALLARVEVVVALGTVGWERWLRAAGWWSRLAVRERPPFGHGMETRLSDGMILITSYHPSRQNTQTGRLTRPMWNGIFARTRELLGQRR